MAARVPNQFKITHGLHPSALVRNTGLPFVWLVNPARLDNTAIDMAELAWPGVGLAWWASIFQVVQQTMEQAASQFGEQAELAARLLASLGIESSDGSHDRSHLLRVWLNAKTIADAEPGCDLAVLTAAVILHDCVAVEKNSSLRAQASRLSAVRASAILQGLGWPSARIEQVAHAIEAHSFSAAIIPRTPEARIVQDADRLDAIGAIGIARCFYVAGRMGSSLYDPDDPSASHRALDDRMFALDHFSAKLFQVAACFQTKTGALLAQERTRTMHGFVDALLNEIAREKQIVTMTDQTSE